MKIVRMLGMGLLYFCVASVLAQVVVDREDLVLEPVDVRAHGGLVEVEAVTDREDEQPCGHEPMPPSSEKVEQDELFFEVTF